MARISAGTEERVVEARLPAMRRVVPAVRALSVVRVGESWREAMIEAGTFGGGGRWFRRRNSAIRDGDVWGVV